MLNESARDFPSHRSGHQAAENSRDDTFFSHETGPSSIPFVHRHSAVLGSSRSRANARKVSKEFSNIDSCAQLLHFSEMDDFKKFVRMFYHMFSRHGIELCFIIFSFGACVALGAVHVELVDISFFKAVGLLLAVLLSLRAKMAMGRRQKLMNGILSMMNSARNIVELTGTEASHKRDRLRKMLAFCFAEIAIWAVDGWDATASEEATEGPMLEDVSFEDRDMAFVLRGKGLLHASPRPLLVYLRQMCDELFDPEHERKRACRTTSGLLGLYLQNGEHNSNGLSDEDEPKMDTISVIRRFHRNIEIELHNVTDQFDNLLMYKEELHTTQFRWMISSVILLYVALYPWCIWHESTLVLGGTTAMMAFVFYGLNAMTEQLEDPVAGHEQGFDLGHIFRAVFRKLTRDEAIRVRCMHFLREKKEQGCNITDELHTSFVKDFAERGEDDEQQETDLSPTRSCRRQTTRQSLLMTHVGERG